jgi:hypothetical protein
MFVFSAEGIGIERLEKDPVPLYWRINTRMQRAMSRAELEKVVTSVHMSFLELEKIVVMIGCIKGFSLPGVRCQCDW